MRCYWEALCVPCICGQRLTKQLWAVQGKYDVIKMSECNNVRAHKEKKREEELAGLQHDFTLKKEKLRSLVEQHNLRDADPLGASPCLSLNLQNVRQESIGSPVFLCAAPWRKPVHCVTPWQRAKGACAAPSSVLTFVQARGHTQS